jgi:hypothetical protein
LGGVLPQMNANRAISGSTNENGDVGFGMGGGAYYWPAQGQIGPHATWIHGSQTRSELILGLGMVAQTNHDHFDVEFTRYDEDPNPPEPGCDLTPVLEGQAEIMADVAALDAKVGQLQADVTLVMQGLSLVTEQLEALAADVQQIKDRPQQGTWAAG